GPVNRNLGPFSFFTIYFHLILVSNVTLRKNQFLTGIDLNIPRSWYREGACILLGLCLFEVMGWGRRIPLNLLFSSSAELQTLLFVVYF
ncbi:MAG: hypothetical protein ACI956_002510, partial [Nonlabens sp.]